ncbi:hypothetical protein F4604DRAFT_1687601 [Suillus subluteus]|nr:hypothetical protein F4604DRAFT_1687601 [Suillus subluteus]
MPKAPPAKELAHQLPPLGAIAEETTIVVKGIHQTDIHGDLQSSGGAWFSNEDLRNLSVRVPEHLASQNAGELTAMLESINSTPQHNMLKITGLSKKNIKNFTVDLCKKETLNWESTPDATLIKVIVAKLRQRSGLTMIQEWNKTLTENKNAEELAKASLLKNKYDVIATDIERPFDSTGLQISQGSQKIFYQSIRKFNGVHKQRRQTIATLALTQHTISGINGATPSPQQVWVAIRDRNIPCTIRGFLWKNLHRGYKIREFWSLIPNYEQRSNVVCAERLNP